MHFRIIHRARFARKLTGTIVAGALAVQTPVAQAAQYIITYTGTILNSFDTTGVFGPAGRSLDGLTFTARYTLTVPTPGALMASDGSTYAEIYGGAFYGAASPLSGTITIAGITQSVAGAHRGEVYQWNNRFGNPDNVAHQLEDNSNAGNLRNDLSNSIRSTAASIVASIDYTQPLDYTMRGDELFNGGRFDFYLFDTSRNVVVRNAFGDLRNTRVTIAPVGTPVPGGVPEPATWAMMILGFGAIGLAARRRVRQEVRVPH